MRKTIEELSLNLIGGQILRRIQADPLSGEEAAGMGKIIVGGSVKPGYIDDEALLESEFKTVLDPRKMTKEGDVVIKITAPFAAAYIDKAHEGLLVSSFCAIINGFPKELDPRYFAAYLNAQRGRSDITRMMNGSTISTIGIRSLRQISVLVPSLERQREIASAFEEMAELKTLVKQLADLHEEKMEALMALTEGER